MRSGIRAGLSGWALPPTLRMQTRPPQRRRRHSRRALRSVRSAGVVSMKRKTTTAIAGMQSSQYAFVMYADGFVTCLPEAEVWLSAALIAEKTGCGGAGWGGSEDTVNGRLAETATHRPNDVRDGPDEENRAVERADDLGAEHLVEEDGDDAVAAAVDRPDSEEADDPAWERVCVDAERHEPERRRLDDARADEERLVPDALPVREWVGVGAVSGGDAGVSSDGSCWD